MPKVAFLGLSHISRPPQDIPCPEFVVLTFSTSFSNPDGLIYKIKLATSYRQINTRLSSTHGSIGYHDPILSFWGCRQDPGHMGSHPSLGSVGCSTMAPSTTKAGRGAVAQPGSKLILRSGFPGPRSHLPPAFSPCFHPQFPSRLNPKVLMESKKHRL